MDKFKQIFKFTFRFYIGIVCFFLGIVYLITGDIGAFGGGMSLAAIFFVWDATYKPKDKSRPQHIYHTKWNYPETLKSNAQATRLDRARGGDLTAKRVDRNKGKAVFVGTTGGDYKTTLDKCTCPDFQKREMPCKHMYYLADACGLLNNL